MTLPTTTVNFSRLLPADSAVLVIDIQEKLLAAMQGADAQRVVRVSEQVLTGAGALGVPVLFTEQYPKGLGPTAESLVALAPDANRVAKTEFDGTEQEAVRTFLEGKKQVLVLGMEAHICVHQTVRSLCSQHAVHVISDGTCARNPDHHRLAEAMWRQSGPQVSCGEAVLFDWLAKAGGGAFKTISRAIR